MESKNEKKSKHKKANHSKRDRSRSSDSREDSDRYNRSKKANKISHRSHRYSKSSSSRSVSSNSSSSRGDKNAFRMKKAHDQYQGRNKDRPVYRSRSPVIIRAPFRLPNKGVLANIIQEHVRTNKKTDTEEVERANVNFKKLDNSERKVSSSFD